MALGAPVKSISNAASHCKLDISSTVAEGKTLEKLRVIVSSQGGEFSIVPLILIKTRPWIGGLYAFAQQKLLSPEGNVEANRTIRRTSRETDLARRNGGHGGG